MLLEAGADVNGFGEEKLTPLILALRRRELDIVQRLFGECLLHHIRLLF